MSNNIGSTALLLTTNSTAYMKGLDQAKKANEKFVNESKKKLNEVKEEKDIAKKSVSLSPDTLGKIGIMGSGGEILKEFTEGNKALEKTLDITKLIALGWAIGGPIGAGIAAAIAAAKELAKSFDKSKPTLAEDKKMWEDWQEKIRQGKAVIPSASSQGTNVWTNKKFESEGAKAAAAKGRIVTSDFNDAMKKLAGETRGLGQDDKDKFLQQFKDMGLDPRRINLAADAWDKYAEAKNKADADKAFKSLSDSIEEQRMTIGMTAKEAMLYKASLQGLSADQLLELEASFNALEKATTKAQKAQERLQTDTAKLNQLFQQGEQVTKANQTPLERFADEINHLDELLQQDVISLETYERAVGSAQEQLSKGFDAGKVAAPSADVFGSREAISTVINARLAAQRKETKLDPVKIAEEQRELQRKQLQRAEEIIKVLKEKGQIKVF